MDAKNIILPSPNIVAGKEVGEDPQGRRNFINSYIDKYISEYISEFMRLNRTSENKFNIPQITDKLKRIYSAKSDAQIMSVNQSDIQILKNEMDDIALASYTRSELTRMNALTVDTSMVKVVADINGRIDALASRLDQGNRTTTDLSNQIKKLKEEIDKVRSTAALTQTRDSIASVVPTAAANKNLSTESPSKLPMILSILAILVAGFAVFSSRRT